MNVWNGMYQDNNREIQSSAMASGLSSSESDSIEVRNSTSLYRLPPRSNRGIPAKRYVPEDGSSRQVEYPIAHYTEMTKLPKLLSGFVKQLSYIKVPESVEEALKDKKMGECYGSRN